MATEKGADTLSNTNEPSAASADPGAGAADPAGDNVGIFTETMWIKE